MLDPQAAANKNLKAPTISFLVSIFLTFVAYTIAVLDFEFAQPLGFTLIGLGVLQSVMQLIFYFQIANEPKPRWSLLTLIFTVLVIVVIIGGSMWIMRNLNYNLMPKMPNA